MKSLVQRTLFGAALLAVLSACSTTPSTPTSTAPAQATAAAGTSPAPATGPGAATTGVAPQSGVATVDLANAAAAGGTSGTASARAAAGAALLAAPSQRVVYFDFDSFAIRSEFNALLDGHAKLLATDPTRRLMIEGHTDDRGGREYNLALGQKRAEAVLRSLTLLGAAERQLEAVSFGKEKPAVMGSDESAWARNRRAELKDR